MSKAAVVDVVSPVSGGDGRAHSRSIVTRLVAMGVMLCVAGILVVPHGQSSGMAPANVRVATEVPRSWLVPMVPADRLRKARTLDLVFVSARCSACLRLASRTSTDAIGWCAGQEVTFVTDSAWPDLRRLAGSQGRIAAHATRTASQFGLRATPTLVSIALPLGRVTRIEVGLVAIRSYWETRSRLCGRPLEAT